MKGIRSYCVILKMVIWHDSIKTIQNGVFLFFQKRKKTVGHALGTSPKVDL